MVHGTMWSPAEPIVIMQGAHGAACDRMQHMVLPRYFIDKSGNQMHVITECVLLDDAVTR